MNILKENKFPPLDKKISLKLAVSYNSLISLGTVVDRYDPINKLLNNYHEIKIIKEIGKENLTKYLYFNKENVHKILYDSNETIHIEYNNNLSYNYYLLLLINNDKDILNYTFDFSYINKMFKDKKNNDSIFSSLIMSKIILELINEYNEIYDVNDENDVLNEQKIISDANDTIVSTLTCFDSLNLKNVDWKISEFCSKKIDEIYIELINSLIKSQKIEEENIYIFDQLDLENIILTEKMLREIYKTLNSDEDYINDYLILNGSDMSNKKKINFYYILLKYILKNQIFIYEINFLNKTREMIKRIIKDNKKISCRIKNDENLEKKVKYLIEIFAGNKKYYYNKCKQARMGDILKDRFNSSKKKSSLSYSVKSLNSYSKSINKNERKSQAVSLETAVIKAATSQEVSELDCLNHLFKLLSNSKNYKKIKDLVRSDKNDKDREIDLLIDELEIKDKKEKELIKKIMTNKNFGEEMNGNINDNFDSLLKSVFYFNSEKEDINLKKKLPYDINLNSIQSFKNWFTKEKEKEK